MLYVYGAIPLAPTQAMELFAQLALELVGVPVADIGGQANDAAVALEVHPFASFAVMVYAPEDSPVKLVLAPKAPPFKL